MKLAVIADSRTGNTRQAADWIVQGMNQVRDMIQKVDLFLTFAKDGSHMPLAEPMGRSR